LSAGVNHDGTISLGDLDVWTFEANEGNNIVVRMQELTGGSFSPSLRLYGPIGQVLSTHTHATLAQVSFTAPDSGIYVIVASSGSLGYTGTYQITATGLPAQDVALRHVRQPGNTATINWPSSMLRDGWILQDNETLNPATWENVTGYHDNSLNVRILVVPEEGNRFFRLLPPQP